ncbi:Ger(x)C family spore germination protein [Halobacillus halophilus]|uniref:Ger(x)C family spore germination protein n=1 Tax=Halobacillus halophilus TaxID=1570 RepID=UPI001CD75BBE|nr:Ger(x)C family spore germination protein [Halobacillus halophilus]MCA1012358.1 Ger(x)C family spore germination protein [Halobacillus halophilus]
MKTYNFPFRKLLLILICLLLLTGCWNSRELDELGIVVTLGIDKTDEGDYILSVQVINPSEIATDAPTSRPPVSTYTTTGRTLMEAFRRLTAKNPRTTYLSQLRLVILGKTVAEEGVMPVLDLLYRDHEFRTSFYVTVAKNAPVESMLSIITPYEKIPANKIMSSIENVERHWAATKGVSIDKVIASIRNPGEDPVMSGILLLGEEDIGTNISNVENVDAPTKLEIDEIGVFKGDKLVGWLNELESQGLNYATGNVHSTVITHPCQDEGSLSVELLRTSGAMKGKIKNNQPVIDIKVEAEGNVGEVDCKVDLSKPEALEKVNKQAEKAIKESIEATLAKAQKEYGSDVFGFGGVIHRDQPKYWKKVEKEWSSYYQDVEVNIDATVKIRRKGNSTQPINKES